MLEVIVAAAIILVVVTAAAGAWQLYIRTSALGSNISQAAIMAEETGEVLRLLRDNGWTQNIASLSLGTSYQLYWNGSTYSATTSDVILQAKYIRKFTLSSVNRDASYNVVSSGGSNDPNTRKALITVVLTSATTSPLVQSAILIHNVYNN